MVAEDKMKQKVESLLREQMLGVLATHEPQQPYLSLVAFCHTSDLKCILVATDRDTRKFTNLARNPRATILFDNRSLSVSDFSLGMAVTAFGNMREVQGSERADLQRLYLEKHPRMRDFLGSPSTALLCLTVEYYYVVNNFRNVTVVEVGQSE